MLKVDAARLFDRRKGNEDDWLAARRMGIGGSDIPAIMGCDKYRSPLDVWLDKTGNAPLRTPENRAMRWGKIIEDLLRTEFTYASGLWCRKQNYMFRSRSLPFAIADLDGIIKDKGALGVWEGKTVNAYQADQWTDGRIPMRAFLQVQWYLYVCRLDYAFVSVLIGGQEDRHIRCERDYLAIESEVAAAKKFWDLVRLKVPPEPDGSEAYKETISRMYPVDNKETLNLESDAVLGEWEGAKKANDATAAALRLVENKMRSTAGEYERVVFRSGRSYTLSTVSGRVGVDLDALKIGHKDVFDLYKKIGSPYRVLRVQQ